MVLDLVLRLCQGLPPREHHRTVDPHGQARPPDRLPDRLHQVLTLPEERGPAGKLGRGGAPAERTECLGEHLQPRVDEACYLRHEGADTSAYTTCEPGGLGD